MREEGETKGPSHSHRILPPPLQSQLETYELRTAAARDAVRHAERDQEKRWRQRAAASEAAAVEAAEAARAAACAGSEPPFSPRFTSRAPSRPPRFTSPTARVSLHPDAAAAAAESGLESEARGIVEAWLGDVNELDRAWQAEARGWEEEKCLLQQLQARLEEEVDGMKREVGE